MIHSASIACGDMLDLKKDVTELERGGIRFLHIDIMDGHDVPNFCLNLDHIRQLRKLNAGFVLETHMMVTNACDYIEKCAEAGSNYFIVHPSNVENIPDYLRKVKANGMKAGLALKTEDSVAMVMDYLDELDEVLLMSVTPGDYGRPFNPIVYGKVSALSALKKERGMNFLINVDGGVTREIARELKRCGADAAVSGVFTIFKQPEGIYQSIRNLNAFIDT